MEVHDGLRGARALVDGGAGFIGIHVVTDLLREDVAEAEQYRRLHEARRASRIATLPEASTAPTSHPPTFTIISLE
jgi:hypothetical protein